MQITKNPSYYTWLPNFVRRFFSSVSALVVWLFTPPRVFVTVIILLLAAGGYWAGNNWTIVPKQAPVISSAPPAAPYVRPSAPQPVQQAPIQQPEPQRSCLTGFKWNGRTCEIDAEGGLRDRNRRLLEGQAHGCPDGMAWVGKIGCSQIP